MQNFKWSDFLWLWINTVFSWDLVLYAAWANYSRFFSAQHKHCIWWALILNPVARVCSCHHWYENVCEISAPFGLNCMCYRTRYCCVCRWHHRMNSRSTYLFTISMKTAVRSACWKHALQPTTRAIIYPASRAQYIKCFSQVCQAANNVSYFSTQFIDFYRSRWPSSTYLHGKMCQRSVIIETTYKLFVSWDATYSVHWVELT